MVIFPKSSNKFSRLTFTDLGFKKPTGISFIPPGQLRQNDDQTDGIKMSLDRYVNLITSSPTMFNLFSRHKNKTSAARKEELELQGLHHGRVHARGMQFGVK
jgi:hypothetical protein